MTDGGSVQQQTYLRLRGEGSTMTTACVLAGISMGEARLIEAEEHRAAVAEGRAPFGRAVMAAADQTSSPAAGQPQPAKEETMSRASAKRAAEEAAEKKAIAGERPAPDAAGALKIFREEIKPRLATIAEKKGDLSEPYKRIKDNCHFPRKVLDFLVTLEEMEEAKRDHWLLALHTGLRELKLSRPFDLVARAEGADPDEDIVPAGAQSRPRLATVPESDGVDADLAGDDDDVPLAAE